MEGDYDVQTPAAAEVPEDIDDVVDEEDYGSDQDSDEDGRGMRIDPEVLEELQYMTRNIKEDQLEESFKAKMSKLFADMDSLN
jgi:hypothetical protein